MKTELYAGAVIEMTKRGAIAKEAVHTLAKHLERRGMANAMRRLRGSLEKKALAEGRRSTVVLEVADHHHGAMAKKEAAEQIKALGATADDVTVREDDSLIGGWRLMGKGTLVDNSFKKQLLSFYKQITR